MEKEGDKFAIIPSYISIIRTTFSIVTLTPLKRYGLQLYEYQYFGQYSTVVVRHRLQETTALLQNIQYSMSLNKTKEGNKARTC